MTPPLLLVSNRGPLSWSIAADGSLNARRGGGGLVSGLGPLFAGSDTIWLASALSDGDRQAAALGRVEAEGLRVAFVVHEPDVLSKAYDEVGNALLWFLHHGLFELAHQPRFDAAFADAWQGFVTYNQSFASAIIDAAPRDAVVLVQDYHLSLVAPFVRSARTDLRLVHFAHTPFAGPDWLRVLPDPYRHELLMGLAANTACVFHCARWRDAFVASCSAFGVEAPAATVVPLGPDPSDLAAVAGSEECRRAGAALDEATVGQRLIVRVDRVEPSKNIVRGFLAYDEMLERHPQFRGGVTFVAFVYPSRDKLAPYVRYRSEVESVVAAVNERWGTDTWQPILLSMEDNFARSVAALERYDVLMVNPIRDGMNLVAKEGPIVNTVDGSLVLSTETGAWDELGRHAFEVHPFDISGTAAALAAALAESTSNRAARAAALRATIVENTPAEWLAGQLAAADAN